MEIMDVVDTPPSGPEIAKDIDRATESLTKLAALRNKVWQCGFPPLPVVVNNVDADRTFTSSYNLLMTIFQNQPPGFYGGQDRATFCKNQIYPAIRMHTEFKAFVDQHAKCFDEELPQDNMEAYIHSNITLFYNVILSCFRVYIMNMLENTNIDLRFRDHDDISSDDIVCKEMQQWLLESSGLDCTNMRFTQMMETFVCMSVSEHDAIMTALNKTLNAFDT